MVLCRDGCVVEGCASKTELVLDAGERAALEWEALEVMVLGGAEDVGESVRAAGAHAAAEHIDEGADGAVDAVDGHVAVRRQVTEAHVVRAGVAAQHERPRRVHHAGERNAGALRQLTQLAVAGKGERHRAQRSLVVCGAGGGELGEVAPL